MANVTVQSLEPTLTGASTYSVKATVQVFAGHQEVILTFTLEDQPSLDKAHENAIRRVYIWGQWVSRWAAEALSDLGLPTPTPGDDDLR